MCKLAQTSSIYQPPAEDPSRCPEVTTHTDSEFLLNIVALNFILLNFVL